MRWSYKFEIVQGKAGARLMTSILDGVDGIAVSRSLFFWVLSRLVTMHAEPLAVIILATATRPVLRRSSKRPPPEPAG